MDGPVLTHRHNPFIDDKGRRPFDSQWTKTRAEEVSVVLSTRSVVPVSRPHVRRSEGGSTISYRVFRGGYGKYYPSRFRSCCKKRKGDRESFGIDNTECKSHFISPFHSDNRSTRRPLFLIRLTRTTVSLQISVFTGIQETTGLNCPCVWWRCS